jgi:hypothetical protein
LTLLDDDAQAMRSSQALVANALFVSAHPFQFLDRVRASGSRIACFTRLEIERGSDVTVGSNPTPSALIINGLSNHW